MAIFSLAGCWLYVFTYSSKKKRQKKKTMRREIYFEIFKESHPGNARQTGRCSQLRQHLHSVMNKFQICGQLQTSNF